MRLAFQANAERKASAAKPGLLVKLVVTESTAREVIAARKAKRETWAPRDPLALKALPENYRS